MKKGLTLLTLFVVAGIFMATGLYAKTDVPDVIEMNTQSYKKDKYGVAKFTHKKHVEEYAAANPKLYENSCGNSCGACHHDDKGTPLTLEKGDDVQKCIECHKIPEKPNKSKTKNMSKEDKTAYLIKYHAGALHLNCIGCHKAFKKATKSKAAPTSSCKKCHLKNKKK